MISVQSIITTFPPSFISPQPFSELTKFELFFSSWKDVQEQYLPEKYYIKINIFEFQVSECTVAFGFPSDLRKNEEGYFSDEIIARIITRFSTSLKCCSQCTNLFFVFYSQEVISSFFSDDFFTLFEQQHNLTHLATSVAEPLSFEDISSIPVFLHPTTLEPENTVTIPKKRSRDLKQIFLPTKHNLSPTDFKLDYFFLKQ
jgi:hypothetical protein